MPGAHLEQHRRVDRAGVEQKPSDLDAGHVGDRHRHHAVIRHQGGEAEAKDHGVRALDLDRVIQLVDPRGKDRFMPRASALLIVCTESDGLATKN